MIEKKTQDLQVFSWTFCFSFEYPPQREAPRLEHQTPTTQTCALVGLEHFAEMSILYREIFTDKESFLSLQLVSAANGLFWILVWCPETTCYALSRSYFKKRKKIGGKLQKWKVTTGE